ncbi:Protein phosphatase methylesterase 1 [Wickerhamiella sorbophila]|uniref:Protein phosphatase methylesterase 1 n=1 Tax=Wickerhamiella sorbophila TaxID=45607 RepID=A0A2T0FLU8_9ASCO|nr:Protein phosphatase methylesterase 1 [Wickerhamiella sorbophila]PRT55947.1 Protein phosphatase methylesterase 1 [Wickerhamiella sorbophila]
MAETVELRGQKFATYFISPPPSKPLAVFQHGIGSSRHTFTQLIDFLLASDLQPGILSFDARSHGETTPIDPSEPLDLYAETLEEDLEAIVKYYLDKYSIKAPLLIIGHSMGGNIASQLCKANRLPNVRGLVVLDAVEGYAVQSLSSMPSLVKTWPSSFASLDEAAEWGVRSRQLRSIEAARTSVPGMLKNVDGRFVWVLDLLSTKPFWDSWFKGLDQAFLGAGASRLLILAGTGRLDKDLLLGQMQGKYQLVVFNDCGHFLHEDRPNKVGLTIVDFWDRNAKPPVIPKFGKFRDD